MDQLICRKCQTAYGLDEPVWRCACGGLLDVEFTPRFDRERIGARPPSLWRYREALPVGDEAAVTSFGEVLSGT